MLKRILLSGAVLASLSLAGAASATDYRVVAPASPGGGWDQTARAIQTVMQETGVASSVQVLNVPGAGGTIGLAQFASQNKGDPSALIVGGYVMVGAILTNNAPVTLADVTPIARLTGEYEAIVVPASSPYQSIDDLVAALKKDPGAVSWAGGSAGGTDHIAAGLIAQAAGVDPKAINYIPYSGGGEALAAILGSQVSAGISGYGEFEGQIQAGQLRLLAMTSEDRIDGVDAPTLKESGLDVVLQNWRMVAAAPGLSDEQKAAVTADVEKMAKSKEWQEILESKGWEDTYLAGDAFKQELDKNIEQTRKVLQSIGLIQG
ncbi:Bug family tripartite tricarboxylate transporter substrate binding protein [Mangrovibrevibacter kandeliae]|uniref:Bug family tripartite tricarboxylate transporter substrate binding protein n=1 Tax=Mangrovibrevibacter kandeliae TaxID=2968473 RepID=UPI00211791C3|nr:tripartite tricarboxylate transporter substrate binding protein [Aurantimonas sp. CSK15Z-1]MCQ8782638.1 tripartite tricarboxylate transporter substrate binding protein [Aurantimonas sp. CSK15Z-1]